MRDFLLEFHSGWRFLVLLAMAFNFLYFAYVLVTRSGSVKQDRRVGLLFGVAVDVQIVLGFILLIYYAIDGGFDASTHLGHMFPMLLLAPVAHAHSIYSRRAKAAEKRMAQFVGLLAPAIGLGLVFGGLAVLDGIGLFTMS